MKRNLIVLIFDEDKMPQFLWKSIWKEDSARYASRVTEKEAKQVIKEIDKITEF
ncbi:MAG: hypothetical protein AABY22_00400 [Nanoarchaeota archaeon]